MQFCRIFTYSVTSFQKVSLRTFPQALYSIVRYSCSDFQALGIKKARPVSNRAGVESPFTCCYGNGRLGYSCLFST